MSTQTPPRALTWEDWDALYESGRPPRMVSAAECDAFRRHLSPEPGMTAIDIGCGSGAFTRQLSRWGLHTTGYDFSPAALAEAKACGDDGARGYLRYELHDFDANAIPRELEPGSVDLVVFRYSLPFLDRHRLMTDVRRWLHKDGAVYVLAPVRDTQPKEPWNRGLTVPEVAELSTGWGSMVNFKIGQNASGTTRGVVLRGPRPSRTG